MATRKPGGGSDNEHYLTLLDDLIIREYGGLLDFENTNVRLGDFPKMIELRHKLTPPGSDQGEFWAAMNKIRKDVLAGDEPVARKRPKPARSRRGKGA